MIRRLNNVYNMLHVSATLVQASKTHNHEERSACIREAGKSIKTLDHHGFGIEELDAVLGIVSQLPA